MTTMRRIMGLALLAVLLAAGAQAQGLGQGPGLWSSGPNLTKNSDGTYSAPGSAPIKTQAGTGTGTTLPSGVLCVNTTAQATTGLVEEVLATCAVPANTLSSNGMGLRITAWGTAVGNANAKNLRVRFGGIGGTALVVLSISGAGGTSWRLVGDVIRTGAATQEASASGSSASAITALSTSPTAALGGAVDVVVTGLTATAIGDATFKGLAVELLR
jgi:hypothetical protein